MTTMNAEVYDALVNAGAGEAKAREAARRSCGMPPAWPNDPEASAWSNLGWNY